MSKDPIYTDRGLKITDRSLESKEKDLCSTCAAGKITRSFSHAQHRRSPDKGRLWYTDVSGPYTVESTVYNNIDNAKKGGNKYTIILVDSATRRQNHNDIFYQES